MAEEIDDATLISWAQGANWESLIADPEVKNLLVEIKKKADAEEGVGNATRIKLVVVGDGAVGKTSLLISFATEKFPEDYVPTVFENYTAQMKLDGENILLHLWDTAGQEEYDRLRPLSYPGADLILLCFSTAHRPSYKSIKIKWHPEVKHYIPDVPTLLVGTKMDLREHVEQNPNPDFDLVSTEEGKTLAEEIGAHKYVEISAKTRKNLDFLFQSAVKIHLESTGGNSSNPTTSAAASEASGSSGSSAPKAAGKKKGGGGCVLQ